MHAVILDRNKSYFVKVGSVLNFDLLSSKPDTILNFSKVLLYFDDKEIFLGSPFLSSVNVSVKVIKNVKSKKVISLKFRRRKHYMKKIGHRQQYTLVEILSIDLLKKEV